jgi:hypothetical protein
MAAAAPPQASVLQAVAKSTQTAVAGAQIVAGIIAGKPSAVPVKTSLGGTVLQNQPPDCPTAGGWIKYLQNLPSGSAGIRGGAIYGFGQPQEREYAPSMFADCHCVRGCSVWSGLVWSGIFVCLLDGSKWAEMFLPDSRSPLSQLSVKTPN